MNRTVLRHMIQSIVLTCFVTRGAFATPLDRPRDLATFYAEASVMFANYLEDGETLRNRYTDSRDRAFHYDWAQDQDSFTLRVELENKVRRLVDLREKEGIQVLADVYGHIAATWVTYGVDFGNADANHEAFAYHATWARDQAGAPIKSQLTSRIAKLVDSYSGGLVPTRDRLDDAHFYADASMLLTQFLRSGESLGDQWADSRRRSVHLLWGQDQSSAQLETELNRKLQRMVDLRYAEGRDSVANFYASVATTWSYYGVDFGNAAANSDDFSRHADWARRVHPYYLKTELTSRVSRILRALPTIGASLEKAWSCAYGDPSCNSCIVNVENLFHEGVFGYRRKTNGGVEEGPTGRLHIRLLEGASVPPVGQTVTGPGGYISHVQSIVRLPANGTGSWLVMGRKRPSLGAPFYVFQIGGPPQNHGGSRFVPFNPMQANYYDAFRDNLYGRDRTRAYLEIPTTEHIGGMQAVGNIVAMPVTCEGNCTQPAVMFWDFASPIYPRLLTTLSLPGGNAAHWVALARLQSGQYLLIVNRGDDGTTDPFLSRRSDVLNAGTMWHRLPQFNMRTGQWSIFQNVNFVNGCGSNELYLVGMRQYSGVPTPWHGDNLAALFKVEDISPWGAAPLSTSYVSSATFERFGDYCQMRGGSSVYVEPNGSPVIYCAAGQSDSGALKVSEVTALGSP